MNKEHKEGLLELANRIDEACGSPIHIDHTAAEAIRSLLSSKEHPKGLEVVAWVVETEDQRGHLSKWVTVDRKTHKQYHDSLNPIVELVTLTNAQAYAEQRVKEAIEEVILACKNERVEEIAEEDVAYNTAIKHVVEAIRALGEKK